MIYFCADDYGISSRGNNCIENCLENGKLNKVSVLPNGEINDFKKRLTGNVALSLHINLVEGYPLSDKEDVSWLINHDGCFKYSFMGLILQSFSIKRKEIEKQIYREIQSQIRFWKKAVGEETEILIDSHQHTHMIPYIFRTLMRVIKDEGLKVKSIRFPAEPTLPYIFTPSLYLEYSLAGLIKHWILKILAIWNRKELKKSGIDFSYFMGVMFSGKLTERRIKKLLPRYMKLAERNNRDIEIGFHPGYIESQEDLIKGKRESFTKFYISSWRNKEYDTLINFKF